MRARKDGLHVISLYSHIMPQANLQDIIKKYKPKEVFECLGFEKDVSTYAFQQEVEQ